MWMELQDKKQTPGDFFSLYKDPPCPDSTPPSHGFFPKTRDFLQPLERAEASGGGGGQRRAPPVAGAAAGRPGPAEHAPSGRFGACGPDHVRPTAVKPEWPACAAAAADGGETRAEARRGNAFTLWEEEVAVCPRDGGGFAGKGTQQQQQQQRCPPPSPFPAARDGANGRFPSFPPSREHQPQDKRCPMVAASRSSRDFAEDDDEGEEDFGKEEKPYRGDLAVKVDRSIGNNGDNSSKDQTPTTPRSKHSATEQRRRTKINDRFQILRDLIPHSDQKRDKASFLLEVIEYIQFLQEKVQKCESSCPGWNQANAKLMPWKSCQAPGASIVDHSHIIKDHPASTGFIFPADGTILNAPAVMSNSQNVPESENQGTGLASKSASMPIPMQDPVGVGGGFSQPQLKFISDSESMAAQPQSRWLRSSVMDGSVGTDVLSGHEELTVDEGTNSLSSLYSERLLTTLTEALQHSGVDISQANISVLINLHRRTTSRRISGNKDRDDPISSNQAVHSAVGSSGDESERARKKHKPDTS